MSQKRGIKTVSVAYPASPINSIVDSPVSWNVPHASPVVVLHGQILQCLHTQVDTQAITQYGVHKPLKHNHSMMRRQDSIYMYNEYGIHGKFRRRFIFAHLALTPEGKFQTVLFDFKLFIRIMLDKKPLKTVWPDCKANSKLKHKG